jgi:monomeric isocitrate dehydrogenase
MKQTFPKYNELGINSRNDFKRFLWKVETEEEKTQFRRVQAAQKAAREKAAKEEAPKAHALTEAVDKAIEEVVDAEKVLVGSSGGLSNKSTSNYVFFIDSGATSHMVQSSDLMSDFSVEKTVIQQAEKGNDIVSIGRGIVKG